MSKTTLLKNKVIFYGYKEIDQKMLLIIISFEKNMYVIQSQHGNVQHKI